MEEIFSYIAKQEDGKYTYTDMRYQGGAGSKVPVTYYELDFVYNNHKIRIKSELGNHDQTTIESSLTFNTKLHSFTVTNRSHYIRLIRPKLNILKIKCKDQTTINFIQEILITSNLENLSRENLFEPIIEFEKKGNEQLIITKFHLAFENKAGVLFAIIQFYKFLIDYKSEGLNN